MPRLVIFGWDEIAELAHYYFSHETDYEVAAFTVDEAYRKADSYLGLPAVNFETLHLEYPPSQFDLFIAVGYSKLNQLRAAKYHQAKEKGYKLANYLSRRATIFDNVTIGDNCFILEQNNVQPFVRIGNNVTLWSGNHIGHHSTIEDHCFITSHVVISGGVTVGSRSFIGVNATIRDHITIGAATIIGAGAVILSSTKENSLYKSKETEVAAIDSSKVGKI